LHRDDGPSRYDETHKVNCCDWQMNGIDEAALDNLSLVTKMTKHIRVRASQGATSADELGQFAPLFVWLLRVQYFSYIQLIASGDDNEHCVNNNIRFINWYIC
jgi:hypothetical protein